MWVNFPIYSIPLCSLAGPTYSVACWTPASKDRLKMTSLKAHIMLHIFAFALLPRIFPTTATTIATPINTCCPPGHFLAIEDVQESKQDPEGVWTPDSDLSQPFHESWRRHEELPNALTKAVFTESYIRHKGYELMGLQPWNRWDRRLDRHQYISRVFCVPDKNDLPSIDGLSGSSLPSPPYYATKEAWRQGIWIKNRVLAESQVLRSKGLKTTGKTCFYVQLFLFQDPVCLPAQADQQSWLPLYLEMVKLWLTAVFH